jgi:peptide/nickel transport system substrate-binding protein
VSTNSRWMRVLALLLGLSLLAAACGDDDDEGAGGEGTATTQGEDGEPAAGGTVTFASPQEPVKGWNINTSEANLLALGQLTEVVFPQAFVTTPDFEVVMNEDLLESAELTSEEPQVVEYVINPDAVWSDGTPISAADFEFQWTMMNGSNPDVDTATTVGYDRIESVEGSEDGKTVTVTFAQPYAGWQSLFENILPAHIIPELGDGDPVVGWNDGLDGENLPTFSGGAFMFDDYRPEQSVVLVPNPEFWGEAPNVDEIVIRFDVDNAGVPAALENGEIDMAYPQPQLDLLEQVRDIEGIQTDVNFGLGFEHIDFNLRNPHLAKFEVREAIALALDREDLVARTIGQFSDEASVLNNRIWLSNQPEYEAHGDEYQEQDIDGARSTLEAAGYDCSSDVCTHPEDGPLSLRISTEGGNQLRENTQLVIQDQLAGAGIEITIDNIEGAAVFDKFFPESNRYTDQDYDIALFAWIGTPFPSSNKALYTSEDPELIGSNNTGYQNEELVALFDEALVEIDREAAVALYNQVDEILWEDLPTIPLFQKPAGVLSYRTTIQGVQDNQSTGGPLWNAAQWSVEG